jgi:hypothetical protein
LLPEHKQGGEGGLDLYFGNRASLTVTRANETVDNLIQNAIADSVDALPAFKLQVPSCDVAWKCLLRQPENLNLGSVRNQSWEMHGTFTLGPVTTTGTYTYIKSRLIGITPKYRQQFPEYTVGARFNFIPEHTYGLGVTYAHGGTMVSTNWQGQGQLFLRGYDLLGLTYRAVRLRQNGAVRMNLPSTYVGVSPAYAKGDLNASQRLTTHIDVDAHVSNIAGLFRNDGLQRDGSIGRITTLGIRLRF